MKKYQNISTLRDIYFSRIGQLVKACSMAITQRIMKTQGKYTITL